MALPWRVPAAFAAKTTAVAAVWAFLALAASPPATAHAGHAYWSKSFLIDRLNGRRIAVGHSTVALRADTLTCAGEGRGVVRGRSRMWKHFRCIQPTFPKGALVGPDALFRVHVTSARRYVISNARMARY